MKINYTIIKRPLISSLLLVFACASFAQGPQRPVILREAVQVPLVLNGKQVGTTTVAAGTKVQVVSEANGKALVAASGGKTWVDSASIVINEPAQVAVQKVAQPSASSAVPANAGKPKRILFVPTFRFDQSQQAIVNELRTRGFEVVIGGRTGYSIIAATYYEMSVANNQVKAGASVYDNGNREPVHIGISLVEPEEGYQMKPWTVLWNDTMVADYDAFIFADAAQITGKLLQKNYGLSEIVEKSGKLVVYGESLTSSESKTEEARKQDRDGMNGIAGGTLSRTREREVFKKMEEAKSLGSVWEKVQPLTCIEEPNRIYYRIYKHSTNKSTKVPTDETMKVFVRNILIPKIATKL